MRFDLIIPRRAPGAKYTFVIKTQTVFSQTSLDTLPVEKTEHVYIYDDYNAIIWNDRDIEKPTLEKCQAEWAIILRERNIEAVYDARRKAYGNIADQLDMIWHDMNSNPTLQAQFPQFYAMIKAVKDSNPLPK